MHTQKHVPSKGVEETDVNCNCLSFCPGALKDIPNTCTGSLERGRYRHVGTLVCMRNR